MMIINCSAAAASHLYGKYKKGVDEGFFEPSSLVNDSVAERQEKKSHCELIQWVVHAVKIGRATCLIAMELNTRWVHVIQRVRKGDVNDFIERLNSRLINGIEWLGADFSLFTAEEMAHAVDRYVEQHHELRFYQQTDRSVMTHISQVSEEYRYVYQCIGSFPEDETVALEFDLQLNDALRSKKSESNYWRVSEKMLEYWLLAYVGRSHAEVAEALSVVQSAESESLMNMQMLVESLIEDNVYPEDNNVIDLAAFRKKARH